MQVRPPGLGARPSLLPLASIPWEVGWGDLCGGRLHTPDLPGILRDGPVTGELARACNVPDDFLSPLPGVLGRGEAMSALGPAPSSVPAPGLAGLWVLARGWFKHCSVRLSEQQNLPQPCPRFRVCQKGSTGAHSSQFPPLHCQGSGGQLSP